MVPAKATSRRSRLLGLLPPCCVFWACCWLLALPALAGAAPAACPEGLLESEALGQPEFEVRELRNDLRVVCVALADRDDEVAANTKGLGVQLATVQEDVADIRKALTAEGGFPVKLAGQLSAVEVAAPEGVEVLNQPDVEAVRQATVDGTETMNQNLWALAGLFAGAAVLIWVFKVVRP